MRILFMGSGDVACPALEALLAHPDFTVAAVVTQPDRPKGRHRRLAACPAKICAETAGVPVWTPERVGAPDAVTAIKELAPDIIVVAAYGQYIPESILAIPPLEAINVHPSLLPKYRGATPIQWAVANGESTTGVTILYVSKAMDAGDLLAQRTQPIADTDTAATLTPILSRLGATLLIEVLQKLAAGRAQRQPQDETQATTVYKLNKEDGRVNWQRPAREIYNRMRGFTPWPGCFTYANDRLLKIHWAEVVPTACKDVPGTVRACDDQGVLVATGEQCLRLLDVQPEGKTVMPAAAYVCGHAVLPGQVFT